MPARLTRCLRHFWGVLVVAALAAGGMLLGVAAAVAAEPAEAVSPSELETVDLFAGLEAGRIEAKLIPRDSTEVNLLVTNKTDRPIAVVLPATFAGVPVLGQFFDPQFGQRQQQPQPLGIANNQPWPFNAPANFRRNLAPLWNIAPEQVGRITLPAVCLEHGLPNPRPKFAYEVKPLDEATEKEGVEEVLGMLGRGEVGRRAAQLAVWHLNNDMSWGQLAGLRRKASIGSLPLFGRSELDAARKAAERAVEQARQPRGPAAEHSAAR
jgi:hypothetical protein